MLIYNGQLLPDDTLIASQDNRALRYGDGLFETIRVVNGQMPLLNYHFSRLLSGLKTLEMTAPTFFNLPYLQNQCAILFAQNSENGIAASFNGILRLQIWRKAGGRYTPTNDEIDYLISTTNLATHRWERNEAGLQIGIYEDFRLRQHLFSHLKSSNALHYVIAAKWAKKNSFDEALFRNEKNAFAEGIAHNLFLMKGLNIQTPPLSSGCVAGVMRQFLIDKLTVSRRFSLSEADISLEMLQTADMIFMTNAVSGIRWVSNFVAQEYERSENFDALWDFIQPE
jgi:branched-chain amino acid aminotransferase